MQHQLQLQARVMPSRSVASVSHRCQRGVSILCSSTRTDAGTDMAGRTLEAVLQDAGIEASVLGSVRQRAPQLSCVSVQDRVEPLLQFLQSMQLQPDDLRGMLLRCPRLLSFSMQRQVLPVVQFLQDDLGFDQHQVSDTLKRFPGIMGYGVKSHLVPHCHYLKSLGISEEELPQLILARPQVLGTSIELVITYLRKWLRIERSHVGRLLWSYPLDYSLPRLVMPADTTPVEATLDEADAAGTLTEPDISSSSSGGGSNASMSAQASSSSGDGAGQEQQQQPRQAVSMWGSPDACSWLDIELRKDSSSSSKDGGSNSGGDAPDSSSGEDGKDGEQPPPTAA